MLHELRPAGMMALQLPRALRPRRCDGIRYVAERNAHYPVLLVHGYAATGAVWTPLRRALAEAGFGHIVSLTYNSFAADPVAVSAELTRQALRAHRGHWRPASTPGRPQPRRAHRPLRARGERCAQLADVKRGDDREPAPRRLPGPHRPRAVRTNHAPGRQLGPAGGRCPPARPARWLAYYSDGDRVVPAASARLDDPRLRRR